MFHEHSGMDRSGRPVTGFWPALVVPLCTGALTTRLMLGALSSPQGWVAEADGCFVDPTTAPAPTGTPTTVTVPASTMSPMSVRREVVMSLRKVGKGVFGE